MTDNHSPHIPTSEAAPESDNNITEPSLPLNDSSESSAQSGSSAKSGEESISSVFESAASDNSKGSCPNHNSSSDNLASEPPSKKQEPEVEQSVQRRLPPPLETSQIKPQSPAKANPVSETKVSSQEVAPTQKGPAPSGATPQEEAAKVVTNREIKDFPSITSKPDKVTFQDLLILVVYWIFLVGILAWGANSLLTWKHDVDIRPNIFYNQLCWSQDGESLAFIREEVKELSQGQAIKSSLWLTERFGDQASRLQDNLPERYDLTGWFANDSIIVLDCANTPLDLSKLNTKKPPKKDSSTSNEPSAKEATIKLVEVDPQKVGEATKGISAAESSLSFAEVKVEDRSIRYLNLPIENAQLVGHNKEEVFIAQYLSSDKDRGQINLLSYKPGRTEAKVLVSIPSRQKEMMHVDSVVASPDNARLAIVISVVASLSNSVSEDDDTPLGVWLFNRDSQTLAWTTISANNARDLSVVWSKDSQWLGGVARYVDEAELFAFYGDNNCQAAKLRGVPQEGNITPLITSNAHALTFVSLNRIDCYNFDQQKNVPLLSSDNLEYTPNNLTVSSGGAVAYVTNQYDSPNIYICALNNPTSHKINIPDDSAKQAWYYQEAGNLQYALDYWFKKNK